MKIRTTVRFVRLRVPSLFSSTKRPYLVVINLDLRHFLSVPSSSFDIDVPVVTDSSYHHTFQCLPRCPSAPLRLFAPPSKIFVNRTQHFFSYGTKLNLFFLRPIPPLPVSIHLILSNRFLISVRPTLIVVLQIHTFLSSRTYSHTTA